MKNIRNYLNHDSGQLNESKTAELNRLKKLYPKVSQQAAHLSPRWQLARLRIADISAKRLAEAGEVSQAALDLLFEPPVRVKATPAAIAKHFGLKTLDTLSTNHMTAEQARVFVNLLAQVREWRTEVNSTPGRAFILSSRFIGIGKTHIAEAICDSFRVMFIGENEEACFVNDKPNFSLLKRAKLVTGREFMEAFDAPGYSNDYFLPQHFSALVLDDIGREGSIKFEKRDDENQLAEKQARYFHLIDHLYKTRRAALFITSNLTLEELAEFFGPATWSRLIEMSGRHMVGIKTELPDMRVVKARGGL